MHKAYFSAKQSALAQRNVLLEDADSGRSAARAGSGASVWLTADENHAVTVTWIGENPPPFDDRAIYLGEVSQCVGSVHAGTKISALREPLAVPYLRMGALITGTLSAAEVSEAMKLAMEFADDLSGQTPAP